MNLTSITPIHVGFTENCTSSSENSPTSSSSWLSQGSPNSIGFCSVIYCDSDDALDSIGTIVTRDDVQALGATLLSEAAESGRTCTQRIAKHGKCETIDMLGLVEQNLCNDLRKTLNTSGEMWLIATPERRLDLVIAAEVPSGHSFEGSTRTWQPGWLINVPENTHTPNLEAPIAIVYTDTANGIRFTSVLHEKFEAALALTLKNIAPTELHCAQNIGPQDEQQYAQGENVLRVTERLSHTLTDRIAHLSTAQKLDVIITLAHLLELCAEAGVAHMDVRTDNILCSVEGQHITAVKLCDWGSAVPLAKFEEQRSLYLSALNNNENYDKHETSLRAFMEQGAQVLRAPEVASYLNMDSTKFQGVIKTIDLAKADAWCLGLAALYILEPDRTSEVEYRWTAKQAADLIDTLRDQPADHDTVAYNKILNVAQACLAENPAQRASAGEAHAMLTEQAKVTT